MPEPIKWAPFKNTHTDRVPPFGLVKPSGPVDPATGILPVTRPDSDSEAGLYVNGETSVEPGATGRGTLDAQVWAAYDAGDGAPALGEEWGAAAGSFLLRSGRSGFKALAAGVGGIVNAVRVGASSIASPTGCTGCGWLGGLDHACCLQLTVVAALGRCACTPSQTLYFFWNGTTGRWESADPFAFCDATTATLALQIVQGRPVLFRTDTSRYFVFDCCVNNCAYFTGGVELCDTGDDSGGVCIDPSANLFRVRICWGCSADAPCCPGVVFPAVLCYKFSSFNGGDGPREMRYHKDPVCWPGGAWVLQGTGGPNSGFEHAQFGCVSGHLQFDYQSGGVSGSGPCGSVLSGPGLITGVATWGPGSCTLPLTAAFSYSTDAGGPVVNGTVTIDVCAGAGGPPPTRFDPMPAATIPALTDRVPLPLRPPCAHEGAVAEWCHTCAPAAQEFRHVRACDLYETCTRGYVSPKIRSCAGCPAYTPG